MSEAASSSTSSKKSKVTDPVLRDYFSSDEEIENYLAERQRRMGKPPLRKRYFDYEPFDKDFEDAYISTFEGLEYKLQKKLADYKKYIDRYVGEKASS